MSDNMAEKKKSAYKLCWVCNRRFRGGAKYEFTIPYGGKGTLRSSTAYVHKACKP